MDSEVWLTGDNEVLGKWNGQGFQLTRLDEDTYSGTASFAPSTHITWLATRGSWQTQELDEYFKMVPGREYTVPNHPDTLRATVAHWKGDHTTTGNIKYHDVQSSFVSSRTIIVYLPPDYDSNPTRRYPVLYMHDGQNLMDQLTVEPELNGVEWGADETAQQLINEGKIEPIIIVGLYVNRAERVDEYTPVADPTQGGGGGADAYGRFLKQELKPLIDQTYRTKSEPKYTGIAGSSLGGLVSMYFGMTMSDTFTRLGVISPTAQWANGDIITRVNDLSSKPPLRIWEDIGTYEPDIAIEDARKLRNALVAKGFTQEQDLKYWEVQGASHAVYDWSLRLDDVFMYLYPPLP
jgi:predicted alpha/beta superfamily hydrolase